MVMAGIFTHCTFIVIVALILSGEVKAQFFNVPIGHVQHNVPVIEGAQVTLKVTTGDTSNLIYWS